MREMSHELVSVLLRLPFLRRPPQNDMIRRPFGKPCGSTIFKFELGSQQIPIRTPIAKNQQRSMGQVITSYSR